ncbi:Flp family type IVb pilin [Bordetella holmesii]|uniref:Flp/Fap pilin component n=2 Tax=Bordetella holmesii TaxID=35814 RepID=A0A158M0M9_9BORD|nr:Flp family type IVb pilin [Bordetella holmesii]AHV94012.1 flp/Fap pilin component family protein [Bordetella holmesii ATCC 51541]AIT25500.1 flp/Fap pilin component family protein [Bordetella holmesii 44057]EWM41471.1 flp/Fap pilin component family protein [Bordetella holmesii 41130]EWM46070.1 flp/Fap pilin component family protein [Bordetella holmesii 35009]EWM50220.1 flp/Fap pilin component family protein [Bordetella holmesii 70147]
MLAQLSSFWRDEDGATAIEYGLIAGLIAVAIITAVIEVGDGLNGLFGRISTALTTATDAP